jgi:hypothetical protein
LSFVLGGDLAFLAERCKPSPPPAAEATEQKPAPDVGRDWNPKAIDVDNYTSRFVRVRLEPQSYRC